jgi:hypothetical protein
MMICPHCGVGFRSDEEMWHRGGDGTGKYLALFKSTCSECGRVVLQLEVSTPRPGITVIGPDDVQRPAYDEARYVVWPFGATRPCPAEVPSDISDDYLEAAIVLPLSPKASAALSRRCLQAVLHNNGVTAANLNMEIDQVIASGHLPSYVTDKLHDLRGFGNFAAHPAVAPATGEVIDVEPGEAEWMLDVLDAVFDHYYVKPAAAAAAHQALQRKKAAEKK